MNREPPTLVLKYGELMEVLAAAQNNPTINLQKVRVAHNDIRGEIITTDPVSDGDKNKPRSRVIPFRTQRIGLENDQGLHTLLKSAVGPAFQGEDEDSALKGIYP